MAENKEKTKKQVNNNKLNPSTIKNSWKTLGYTLCFKADNSPTLPHPHPQIQIMNQPDKKKNNTQLLVIIIIAITGDVKHDISNRRKPFVEECEVLKTECKGFHALDGLR